MMASGRETAATGASWQPTASRQILKSRAQQLGWVRGFFAQRGVLEVETPVLGQCGVTDVNIDSIAASPMAVAGQHGGRGWLQSSPEYHMKRLLAAGSGSIYQVSQVFRDGERGRRHNPEFSLLEWYRPGFDDQQLMAEVAELVCGWLDLPQPHRIGYRQLLRDHAGIDPFEASITDLRKACRPLVGDGDLLESLDRDGCLNLLMSFRVEPALGFDRPVFVTRYPASQAALARVSREDGHAVAHRFELYVRGIELCNGYWELTDPQEQRRRFHDDNARRRGLGKTEMPVDERFLAALESGLPDCAGVALGLDRLLMLKCGADEISEVLAFPAERS
ncbi:EF-P lysine aminoacylase EpmA [Marinobacter zhanjiangensis]|uniref:Elongation factor P--(R)-beta-lysine ligase n=1 Tax=Marinobacter zhanjiangensis TaxID=578215 RepID=A0ABQ3B5G0_9GAMM|nr:EF-P lysine aminoacylase EpmA [Marinobacter zhanjiangensis]GGY75591.1 elongation factor P--(R)-beta-lysine ligase [Marinobacter zhanjiangensis]